MQLKCQREVATGKGYAVFNHNTEAMITVNGYPDGRGGYKHQFTYTMDMNTIISVINQSSSCKQSTHATCQGVIFVSRGYTWLNGRVGQKLAYWGGGPSDGIGCACGITNSCVNNYYKCNCDINEDGVIYADSGDVTNKEVLPLTGIAVGDTQSSAEILYYTIGPLKCVI